MKKLSSKKGFTLAELLIVVAIIAVLVAIALPVFGSALDKARFATDVANVRSAYSEALVDAMTTSDTLDAGIEIPTAACNTIRDAAENGSTVTLTSNTSIVVTPTNEDITAVTIDIDGDVTFESEGAGT